VAVVGCVEADIPLTWAPGDVEPTAQVPTEKRARQIDPSLVSALSQAQAQWISTATHDYSVRVTRHYFSAPDPADDVQVVVRDDAVLSVLGNDGKGHYSVPIARDAFRDWYTVPGMFARIEKNLAVASWSLVTYDTTLGFPRELYFDYVLASAEEGEGFEMRDFTPHE